MFLLVPVFIFWFVSLSYYFSQSHDSSFPFLLDRLVNLVVKACASRVGLSRTSDLKIGTPVATLPGIIESVLGLVSLVSVYCD